MNSSTKHPTDSNFLLMVGSYSLHVLVSVYTYSYRYSYTAVC